MAAVQTAALAAVQTAALAAVQTAALAAVQTAALAAVQAGPASNLNQRPGNALLPTDRPTAAGNLNHRPGNALLPTNRPTAAGSYDQPDKPFYPPLDQDPASRHNRQPAVAIPSYPLTPGSHSVAAARGIRTPNGFRRRGAGGGRGGRPATWLCPRPRWR
ncbi:hypothetical protein GCM10010112_83820 [Actinoplanes lobatus]|nr:hypothetical protein GCM10010112_83820 [Actinoplanes lobatus]